MSWKGIVGKVVDIDGFKSHVDGLRFNGWTPSFCVLHNTSAPTAKLYRDWLQRPSWTFEQWLRNLESYYLGQGWSGGPHAFIGVDGRIGLFTPFTTPGTHSPAWNSRTWGIETVGEYMSEPFAEQTRATVIAVLGILHERVGLIPGDYHFGVRGLHFHKEDPKTTHKECPGDHIVKADIIAGVEAYMHGLNPGGHAEVSLAVHEAPSGLLTAYEMTSISWLQSALNRLGAAPPLAEDGALGPSTKITVASWQRRNGLVVDGIAGPVTRIAIKMALRTPTPGAA